MASYWPSLGKYVEGLDKAGKLVRVTTPINKDTELHPLVRLQFLVGDYLELFAIAARAEHSGLGRALLAEVERHVFARTRNLFVCVSDFNHPARRFYARNGYQQVGAIGDLIITGSAELLLRKTIAGVPHHS